MLSCPCWAGAPSPPASASRSARAAGVFHHIRFFHFNLSRDTRLEAAVLESRPQQSRPPQAGATVEIFEAKSWNILGEGKKNACLLDSPAQGSFHQARNGSLPRGGQGRALWASGGSTALRIKASFPKQTSELCRADWEPCNPSHVPGLSSLPAGGLGSREL